MLTLCGVHTSVHGGGWSRQKYKLHNWVDIPGDILWSDSAMEDSGSLEESFPEGIFWIT